MALYACLAIAPTSAAGEATRLRSLKLAARGIQARDLDLYDKAHTFQSPAVRGLLVTLAKTFLAHADIAHLLVPSDAPVQDRSNNANNLTRFVQVALSDMVSGRDLSSPEKSLHAVANLLQLVPALQNVSADRGFTGILGDLQNLDNFENYAKLFGCSISAQYLHAKPGSSKIDPYKIPMTKGIDVLGTGVDVVGIGAAGYLQYLGPTTASATVATVHRGYVGTILDNIIRSRGSLSGVFTKPESVIDNAASRGYTRSILDAIARSSGTLSGVLAKTSRFIDNTFHLKTWLADPPVPERTLKLWNAELKNHIKWSRSPAESGKVNDFCYHVLTYARASLGEAGDLMSAFDSVVAPAPVAATSELGRPEINSPRDPVASFLQLAMADTRTVEEEKNLLEFARTGAFINQTYVELRKAQSRLRPGAIERPIGALSWAEKCHLETLDLATLGLPNLRILAVSEKNNAISPGFVVDLKKRLTQDPGCRDLIVIFGNKAAYIQDIRRLSENEIKERLNLALDEFLTSPLVEAFGMNLSGDRLALFNKSISSLVQMYILSSQMND